MNIPEITLNNGIKVPAIGFGTCKDKYTNPVSDIILKAFEAGYRYFDTASLYGTERDLGKAIKLSGVEREDFAVATKAWFEELGYEKTKDAFQRSLERLGLDYVDFYLIHWPKACADDPDWCKTMVGSWNAMEEMKQKGLVRALGVSNFLPHHIETLKKYSSEKPVVDQLELHIGYIQEFAINYLEANNIQPQAWSPLARRKNNDISNIVVSKIASDHGISVQKLGLVYLIQRGIMPLPWTTKEEHIKENLNSFDVKLTDEEISLISCMPQYSWLGEHPDLCPPDKHVSQNQ